MDMYEMGVDAFLRCATVALRGLDVDANGNLIPASIDDAIEHAWSMGKNQLSSAIMRDGEEKFRSGQRR